MMTKFRGINVNYCDATWRRTVHHGKTMGNNRRPDRRQVPSINGYWWLLASSIHIQ